MAEEICRDQGLDWLNLFDIFLDADPDNLYFHWEDDHWNDRGQEIAAEAMTEYLLAHSF